MRLLEKIPIYFDELSSEELFLLDFYVENKFFIEIEEYLQRAIVQLENCSRVGKNEVYELLGTFHYNLTLESMRRRGLVSISERVYLLDRNTRTIEISLGPVFKC